METFLNYYYLFSYEEVFNIYITLLYSRVLYIIVHSISALNCYRLKGKKQNKHKCCPVRLTVNNKNKNKFIFIAGTRL